MAKVNQRSRDTILLIGLQTAEGIPVENIAAPGTAAGKMLPIRFIGSGLSYAERSDNVQSATYIRGRRTVPTQVAQFWADGGYDCEILPQTVPHLIRILTNPTTLPSGTAYPDTEIIAGGDFTASNTIDDEDKSYDPPAQIHFSGSAVGTATLVGKRRIGKGEEEPFTEVVSLTAQAESRTSKNYFSTVDTITAAGTDLLADVANVIVTAKPNTKQYSYQFNSAGTIPPMTLQMLKGNIPEYSYDVRVDAMTITIGDTNTANITMTGRETKEWTYIAPTGSDGPVSNQVKVPSNYLDDFVEPAIDFFQRWGGELEFDDSAVPYTDFTMEINNNPDTGTPEITGSRLRALPIHGARTTIMSPTILLRADDTSYDAIDNWQSTFRNQTRALLKEVMFNYLENGRRERIEIQAPAAKLNTSPGAEVAGDEFISRSLEFNCESVGGASELTFLIDGV